MDQLLAGGLGQQVPPLRPAGSGRDDNLFDRRAPVGMTDLFDRWAPVGMTDLFERWAPVRMTYLFDRWAPVGMTDLFERRKGKEYFPDSFSPCDTIATKLVEALHDRV